MALAPRPRSGGLFVGPPRGLDVDSKGSAGYSHRQCPPPSRSLPGTSIRVRARIDHRREIPHRGSARHTVPAGNQGRRRRLPGGDVPTASATPTDPVRPADAPRRRDRSARCRCARTTGSTGRPMARRAMSACGSTAASGSRMSMFPPAATFPTASVNPKFGQKLDFIERMTRWSEAMRHADDPGRRLQRRAARMRRVEPQAAAQRRQPHPDRGRGADPAAGRATSGSISAAISIPRPSACTPGGAIARPTGTKNDRGRRLDHMWATADVAALATSHHVHEPCRNWDRPSDHVPLVTEFVI